MKKPNGQSGDGMDKVMLLNTWAIELGMHPNELSIIDEYEQEIVKKIITAGMGKPTYPVNTHMIDFAIAYWKRIKERAEAALADPEHIVDGASIGYGPPQGVAEYRQIMADAMSKWYETKFDKDHIIFTTGGAGGLRVIFDALNLLNNDLTKYRVITPFPHYTLYADNPRHVLHPVDVLQAPGYKLTAEALRKSIQEAFELAETDSYLPRAVLICNPSNPMGTIIDEEELHKIVKVLEAHPQLTIILDEAYAEMAFGKKVPSLLKIAPQLANRTIILRSATKGLSAAGERYACAICPNPELMSNLVDKNIGNTGHAAISAQYIYSHTMAAFDEEQRQDLADFYKKKVDYVYNRLKEMGAALPDENYKIEGTFYVLGDFSELLGLGIPAGTERALGHTGKIANDEELIYSLLFQDRVMVAPLSYYGGDNKKGWLRITCSETTADLKDLMDRLENRLNVARQSHRNESIKRISNLIRDLRYAHSPLSQYFNELLQNITKEKYSTSLDLKMLNKRLEKLEKSIEINTKSVLDIVRLLEKMPQSSQKRGFLEKLKFIVSKSTAPSHLVAHQAALQSLANTIQSHIMTKAQTLSLNTTIPSPPPTATIPTKKHSSLALKTVMGFFNGLNCTSKQKNIDDKLMESIDPDYKQWQEFVDTLFKEPCQEKKILLKMDASQRTNFTPWIDYLEKHKQMEHNLVPKSEQSLSLKG